MTGLFPVAERGYIMYNHKLRAQPTGEFRTPKQGEWYLSGAIIEAYRAPNELSIAYHIARLVTVEVRTSYHITGIVPV